MGKIMEGVASGFANDTYLQEVDDIYEQHKVRRYLGQSKGSR